MTRWVESRSVRRDHSTPAGQPEAAAPGSCTVAASVQTLAAQTYTITAPDTFGSSAASTATSRAHNGSFS